MAPLPQEHAQNSPGAENVPIDPISDDDVVITGVSGLLPNCDSFYEFSQRLYNKENMVSKQEDRWAMQHPELVDHVGLIRGVDKFDAQFFTLHTSLANSTDPVARKIFEQSYQAVFDAGMSPADLNGKNIGVYIASTTCNSDFLSTNTHITHGMVGSSRAMFANRVSYFLNLTGPSTYIDAGSMGFLVALEKGYQAITKGYCEAVLVGAGALVINPQSSIINNRTFQMNKDGKTKCYDAAADGASVSEAITVMYLQKFKDARRVYGVLKYVSTGCLTPPDMLYREPAPKDVNMLSDFFRRFYEQVGVSPSAVEYVDGNGGAILDMDKVELQAMEQVFCKDREKPLLVGSVTSNIGFTDAATGACSIFKILLGYQHGQMAATINCDNPRQDVAAVRDGRLRIATDHAPFDRSYAAVTNFSLTGSHGHALFHGFRKPKDLTKYHTDIPYLILASDRQESHIEKILADIGSRPLDPEEIALLHCAYKYPTTKHLARGFGIYSTENGKTATHCQKAEHFDNATNPLWFVYSGMGSQWAGMGKQLMRIPVFADSIARCHKVLEPKGIDLIDVITSEDESIFDNILNSFVGISAFHIALTDLLTSVGLVPDKIVGHSLGELGCAYADGCLTAEQVMLLSYTRGYVSTTHALEKGAMAAVGLGYKQLSKICPPQIDIACHNSSTSSTISGPHDLVKMFVERLVADGVFAKEVDSSNIAYHSRYISKLGPSFLKKSQLIVTEPKLRSERWVSSSVPFERWSETNAMYSSAEYHTHNLLNTVLFEEAVRFIPANAVVVELAPHGLLQAVLKRAVPGSRCVPLTRRGHPDSTLFLLEGLGNLYMAGYNPDISTLYPRVEYPVSSSTRPLSQLMQWVHDDVCHLYWYFSPVRKDCSVFRQIVTVEDDDYRYLKGHYIEGKRVLPFTAGLVAAWDTLAMTLRREMQALSVQFQDVKFHCQPPLPDGQVTYVVAAVQRGSGHFEVRAGNLVVVEGIITVIPQKQISPSPTVKGGDDLFTYLNKYDIYKLLFERGYHYKDQFRNIHSVNQSMTQGLIQWRDNWVTFLDSILQMHFLISKHHYISQPTSLKNLVIDVEENLIDERSNGLLEFTYDEIQRRTRCGGVTVEHITLKNKVPTERRSVALNTLKFVPFDHIDTSEISTGISNIMQIIAENVSRNHIRLFFVDIPKMEEYIRTLKKIMQIIPDVDLEIATVKKEDLLEYKAVMGRPDAVFLLDLLSDKKIFEVLYHTLPSNTFLISVGIDASNMYPSTIYRKVASMGSGKTKVELARFKPTPGPSNTTAITVHNVSAMHQLKSTCEQLPPEHSLLVLSPLSPNSGLKEQVKLWRKSCRKNVSLVMFDQKNPMAKELEKIPDMAFSALREGKWGGDYFVPTKLEAAPPKGVVALMCTRPGDFSSFSWVGVEEPTNRGIEVKVHYAGLVRYDAMRAQGEGLGTPEGGFGMDFSGVTAHGARVMGLVARGSAASKLRVHPRMLWPVPAHWTMEDAATVPFAYCYALYILSRLCNPAPGMSILVHGGAGALGQALISVSLAYGLEVYATVSDVKKKEFLKGLFPDLKDDHIGNSRDSSFKDMVKQGKSGADIVVSCAKGALKKVAISACGEFGHFIDTTQLVTGENFEYGMMSLAGGRNYRTVDFSGIISEHNEYELRWLQLMLSEGISKGYVRPLSRITYAPHETPRAFRLLAASRHCGRVLLSLKDSSPFLIPRISCQPSNCYVVIYEDEELGLQFADLLVRRGANKLHLHGKQTSYLKFKMQQWKDLGIQVDLSSANLTAKAETLSMLLHSKSMGEVYGIYLVATHPKQKPEDIADIFSNLDLTSRKVCPQLRHFAVISEHCPLWGDIINERARVGLPSLSLKLPKLERFDGLGDVNGDLTSSVGLPAHAAIEAIEKALLSGDAVVAAHAQSDAPGPILEEVAKIPGVNITKAAVDRTCLEQVGVDEGRAMEVCHLLQTRYGITVPPEAVPGMTIGQLKRLKREPLDVEKEVAGFGAYMNIVPEDEMSATNDVVIMPTLVQRSRLRSDEFNISEYTLCVIPGLEGQQERFRPLCERLKLQAAVFPHSHDHLHDSLQQAAERLANSIIKYVAPKRTFYLLGCEFGVLLALEVAAILESYGMTGTVFLIGGTPDDVRTSFNEICQYPNEDSMQNALLHHVYYTVCQTHSPKLEELLHKCSNWPDKAATLVKLLQEKVTHARTYLRAIVDGLYLRIKCLQNYNAQPYQLKSKIVLLQPKPYRTTVQSLKPFTSQEPVVENIRASVAFALQDLACPNIINRHLDSNILDVYSCSNRCNTTLINEDAFVITHR